MTDFLSDEWFAAMAEAATRARPPADLDLSIEQEITGVATWTIRIADGRVALERSAGPANAAADVRIVTDAATAAGIRAGEVSAQRAFLDGDLRIGGDVAALMTHREELASLGLDVV